MIEVKTSELIGLALDWAVCKADCGTELIVTADYSTDWTQGGPLLEQHVAMLTKSGDCEFCAMVGSVWNVSDELPEETGLPYGYGQTPLIAACRAIVSAKIGDTVMIPKELMQ